MNYAGKCTGKREARLDNNRSFSGKTTRNGRRNEVVKSNSLKIRRPNHCIPRRQYSYEELPSHAVQDETEVKKPNKKRNSFIGKLSRLFKTEDGKLTSNDETEDNFDHNISHKEWDKITTNEQAKLLSSKIEMKQQNAFVKESKNGVKVKRKKERGISSGKPLDKKRYSESSAKLTAKHKNTNVNEDESRLQGCSRKCSSRSSKTSNNASSQSRSPDWLNANFSRDNQSTVVVEQNTKCKPSQSNENEARRKKKQQTPPRKGSLSSFSDSNYSFESDSDYSLSSDSSVDLKRKSFHYSEEDTTDDESHLGTWEDCSSKFSSTRAICGDLEMNTLSINQSDKTSSSSDSTKCVENHSVTTALNGNKTSDHNICPQRNNLNGGNLVQFIGIL
ncbi:uncharacterized protein LOC114543296 [Dendronephthya gigantea]|uniref:uncharacterized protein LOC114543296 n=1 Tax=Dendronephthya gigantea TaxID=151771 RepID=UPI0010690450|nr:uncharacterized protein LOC114543296 [Dendronephthya gigantea]